MNVLYISLVILGGLLLLFFVGLFILFIHTYYSPRKGQNNDFRLTDRTKKYCDLNLVNFMIERTRNIPHEDVFIKSYDHHKLHARFYRNDNSNVVVIMMHGYRGTACRDFSGGAYDMISHHFNVLLCDQRAHSESKGHIITFGVREKRDVTSWINYAKKTFGEDKQIILVGISMGGASVLLASDLLKEGDKVIADCPYSTPREIIRETINRSFKRCHGFLYFLTNLSSIIFTGVNYNKDDANEHVKKSKAKFLIIHGDNDSLVPYQFSKRIYDDNQDKVCYELFEGAEHGLCYLKDKDRYQRVINTFLEQR